MERAIIRRTLCLAALTATVLAGAPVLADQRYSVTGTDRYQVGLQDLQTRITYNGQETLTITRSGASRRYTARARYARSDQSGTQSARATYQTRMLPSGEQRDEVTADPNYLTVLNQPFSVQLDGPTLRDLSHLRGRVPFDFPSPMTGGTLHGYLSRSGDAMVGGRHTLGVRFEASGPMRGPLPDHPALALSGRMHMLGTAYYEVDSALLLALDATLDITGTLVDPKKRTPVTITYQRSIRASAPSPARKEASANPRR